MLPRPRGRSDAVQQHERRAAPLLEVREAPLAGGYSRTWSSSTLSTERRCVGDAPRHQPHDRHSASSIRKIGIIGLRQVRFNPDHLTRKRGSNGRSTLSPGARAGQTLTLNMKLLGHHELDGFGGIGEGSNMQMTKDGRRILWLAHESAPKNFTAVDVTDPLKPKMVVQTELPHNKVRSNSLDIVGDIMAVAYQTTADGRHTRGHGPLRHQHA